MAQLAKDHPPLAGVVMCCTSIPPDERHKLASVAEEMGASHKFDLTSDVTHLIIGDVDTPKYKYVAKERPDVKVVLPSFVEAIKDSWIQGGETDLPTIENEHRAPTLYGLRICLTGFEAQTTRDSIKQTVVAHGGEFHGDLTKAVTHLIAASPEGKKYEHGRRWGIKVVAIEWLQDAIEREMILEEKLYDPIIPPQDRGKDAWNKDAIESIKLGKRQREEEKATEPAAKGRKLRRTMSSKLESQQENIWADIASAGSARANHGSVEDPDIDGAFGVLPLQAGSANATPNPTIEPAQKTSAVQILEKKAILDSHAKSSFVGAFVYVHGFNPAKTAILKQHLEAHGANVSSNVAYLATEEGKVAHGFIVTPHNIPKEQLAPVAEGVSTWTQVTEWWVESCIERRMLINPETYPLCKPFPQHRVQGFEGVTICSTGFQGFDLLHLTRVAALMGATYDEYLKPGVDVLICRTAGFSKTKFDFAIENGIETVNEQWLYESIAHGVKQDVSGFPAHSETPTIPLDCVPTKSKNRSFSREGSKKSSLSVGRKLNLEFKVPTGGRLTTSKLGKVVKAVKPKRAPFIEDDSELEDSEVAAPQSPKATSQTRSQPLQPLSQDQQNSPRKSSQSSQPSQILTRVPQDEQDENLDVIPPPSSSELASATLTDLSKQQLNETIASLLALKRSSSDITPAAAIAGPPTRRKRGLLGRATSGSFASTHTSQDHNDQESSSALAGSDNHKEPLPAPSQKIIYEAEGTTFEERRELIRKMGGSTGAVLEEQRLRVESIGVVRDAEPMGGILADMGPRKTRRKR